MSQLFANGQYKIFSVQFPGQDVDLLGGGPTDVIGLYHNLSATNNRWNLVNTGSSGNSFTLASASPSADGAYASVPGGDIAPGVILHGSPTPLVWNAVGTCTAGQYWVFASSATGTSESIPSGLIWSMADGNDGTPITLEPFSNGASNSLQSRAGGISPAFSFAQVI